MRWPIRIAKEFGIEPATPDETRDILGLKGASKSYLLNRVCESELQKLRIISTLLNRVSARGFYFHRYWKRPL